MISAKRNWVATSIIVSIVGALIAGCLWLLGWMWGSVMSALVVVIALFLRDAFAEFRRDYPGPIMQPAEAQRAMGTLGGLIALAGVAIIACVHGPLRWLGPILMLIGIVVLLDSPNRAARG